jgi:DNA-binding NarL/FixJ family response regulator
MSGVLLVDDHPIVLRACRQLIEASGIANILEAHDADGAYQAFLEHAPDLVVIDLSLRGEELGGLALIERIRSDDPEAKILVFSMHADARTVTSAIEAGAAGYLLKDAPPDELPKAVEQVRLGKRYIDQELALKVALLRTEAQSDTLGSLTPREREVLGLLAEGVAYGSIADKLGVSYKTVVNLTYRLRQKLAARGLSDLIRLAIELTRPGKLGLQKEERSG